MKGIYIQLEDFQLEDIKLLQKMFLEENHITYTRSEIIRSAIFYYWDNLISDEYRYNRNKHLNS